MIALLNRLYRAMFCRGGYGVHSPFVFDLLTSVIEERGSYYCYDRLRPVRLQIMQRADGIQHRRREQTIGRMLQKYGLTESEHKLLFRLVNRFQPKIMYVAGSDFGLAPLYLTAFSNASACTVFEPDSAVATVASEYIVKYATAPIDVSNNLNDMPDKLDFVVLNAFPESERFSYHVFEQFLSHISEESVLVIAGINASRQSRTTWKSVCNHPKVTVTIDLCRLGIVFFNPKLHRRTYRTVLL